MKSSAASARKRQKQYSSAAAPVLTFSAPMMISSTHTTRQPATAAQKLLQYQLKYPSGSLSRSPSAVDVPSEFHHILSTLTLLQERNEGATVRMVEGRRMLLLDEERNAAMVAATNSQHTVLNMQQEKNRRLQEALRVIQDACLSYIATCNDVAKTRVLIQQWQKQLDNIAQINE